MRRSFEKMEGNDGGIIPGLQVAKYTFYYGTTVFCDYGSVQEGV